MTAASFFQTAIADRLGDPTLHPVAIRAFLACERLLFAAVLAGSRGIVEVACERGSYLDEAHRYGVAYAGIDVARRNVEAGRRRVRDARLPVAEYQFIEGEAERLAAILAKDTRLKDPLVIFPFSALSALRLDEVAAQLAHGRLRFVASLYRPTPAATRARVEYYKRCGFRHLAVAQTPSGVVISTGEGLRTTAFSSSAIRETWARHRLEAVTVPVTETLAITGTSAEVGAALRTVAPSQRAIPAACAR